MKTIMIIFITLLNIASNSLVVSASDSGDQVPYSVQAVLPENQKDTEVTYFDLEIDPGASQTLEVDVFNSSDEELTINISTNFAATNMNGVITYDGSIDEYDESMQYPFDSIATPEEPKLEIEPGEVKRTTVELEIPEEGFDGQILGGIHFVLENDEETDAEGIGFINEYAYVIGVDLTQTQSTEEDYPNNLTLDEIEPVIDINNASAELVNHRTAVNASFSNKTPILISQAQLNTYITSKNDEEVLFEREQDSFSIGPNNLFDVPIMLDNQLLAPGEYTYHARINSNDDEWLLETDFTVTEEQTETFNEEAVEIEEANNWLPWIISIAVVILILLVIILILLYKLKTKE